MTHPIPIGFIDRCPWTRSCVIYQYLLHHHHASLRCCFLSFFGYTEDVSYYQAAYNNRTSITVLRFERSTNLPVLLFLSSSYLFQTFFNPRQLLLSATVLLLSRAATTSAYELGEDVPICWETNTVTEVRTQLDACPDGLFIEFIKELPEIVYEGKTYESSFKLTVDPTKGYVVEKQANSADVLVDIPHANIHSCLAKIGFCTPFVGNTPGLSTHTTALNGDFASGGVTTFTNEVSLTADGYTIIAHGRVFVAGGATKYDLAAAYRRIVFPPENMITVPEDIKFGMMALAVVSSVILLLLLVATVVKRKHKVMKFSQVEFLVLMLTCGIITSVGSLTLGYFPLDETICSMRPWVTMFPLVVVRKCISTSLPLHSIGIITYTPLQPSNTQYTQLTVSILSFLLLAVVLLPVRQDLPNSQNLQQQILEEAVPQGLYGLCSHRHSLWNLRSHHLCRSVHQPTDCAARVRSTRLDQLPTRVQRSQ